MIGYSASCKRADRVALLPVHDSWRSSNAARNSLTFMRLTASAVSPSPSRAASVRPSHSRTVGGHSVPRARLRVASEPLGVIADITARNWAADNRSNDGCSCSCSNRLPSCVMNAKHAACDISCVMRTIHGEEPAVETLDTGLPISSDRAHCLSPEIVGAGRCIVPTAEPIDIYPPRSCARCQMETGPVSCGH